MTPRLLRHLDPRALRPLLTKAAAAALSLGVLLAAPMASAGPALVSSHEGLAAEGQDVVTFFSSDGPVAGVQSHAIMWRGAIWRFASAQNLALFEANPHAYAPQFGGYCAYALSQGIVKRGDPGLFVISDGRLFLLNNPRALARWQAEQDKLLIKAEGHWPRILKD